MLAIQSKGFKVIACAPEDRHARLFDRHGIQFIDVKMEIAGQNPFKDLFTILHLWRIYRREKPAMVHHFSTKAVLYGSLVAYFFSIPTINTVTGLGHVFQKRGWVTKLVKIFYRLVLRSPTRIIFQNPDDMQYFIRNNMVGRNRSALIKGSGIDITKFSPLVKQKSKDMNTINFLMYGRMLWEKGVKEFVEAAQIVKRTLHDQVLNGNIHFILVGGARKGNSTNVDAEWLANPSTIPSEWLENTSKLGYVEWFPHDDNILPYIHRSDVVVLPSYYPEGLPRSLLEAMACGKAIVTTNTPGCREAVENGVNGFIVRPKDVDGLVDAMVSLIKHKKQVREMGWASREKVIREFSDEIVINQTILEYAKLAIELN